jgi:glycosyltransferase involved in cell wall biosynthesis
MAASKASRNMSHASLTVITVVRNGQRYLPQALESIRGQTCPPSEVIVVDGQSTDDTSRIARAFPGVRYVLQTDLGLAGARNLGLSIATGDYVAFLDHDDQWLPAKLERQMQTLEADPALQYATTLLRFQLDEGWSRPGLTREELQQPRHACTPSALVARRKLLVDMGGFDTRLSLGCDADWFARARDARVPSALVPEVLLLKRLHKQNLSTDVARNRREMFLVARQSIARGQTLRHGDHPAHR